MIPVPASPTNNNSNEKPHHRGCSLCAALTTSGKTWRVNNNPGISADFTTAQVAHDAASAGDTIHLEPSLTNYGGLNITKKLAV
jgi:hypothetical protein